MASTSPQDARYGDLERQVVLGRLTWGRDGAATLGELAESLNWPRRVVEKAVQQLRLDGHPVCSDGSGLWLSYEDLDATIASLRGRLRHQYATLRALQNTARRRGYRQTTLFDAA